MQRERWTVVIFTVCWLLAASNRLLATQAQASAPDTAALDKVLAPVALYPDALIAQILMCATNPSQVRDLHAWLQKNKKLRGTALQQAAEKQGFEPSFVAIVLFPQVVKMMADSIGWTRQLGQAFMADKKAVLDSIQRLRTQAVNAGNRKGMAEDRQKSGSELQSNRQQTAGDRQANRQPAVSDRQSSRQQSGATPSTQDLRSRSSSRGSGASSLPSSYESRGYGQSGSQMSRQRSTSGAGALSGYERGSSSRASSARGQTSIGGRSRGGGRRR